MAAQADAEAALRSHLPPGWEQFEKAVTGYEWRCPYGATCGKNNKKLYSGMEKDSVLERGSWHLNDSSKHGTEYEDLAHALIVAEEGLTETTWTETWYLDEEGQEHAKLPPKPKPKPEPRPAASRRGGSKGGDRVGVKDEPREESIRPLRTRASIAREKREDESRERGRRRRRRSPSRRSRSRSRSRRREETQLVSRTSTVALPIGLAPSSSTAPSMPFQMRDGPRPHEVVIGRVELDSIIDGIQRCQTATDAAAGWVRQFMGNAVKCFEEEGRHLEAARTAMERFRRA